MGDRKIFRCAIYTRKSSEEGLEQDFNSLEAQREACEAYIRSQEHEGWRLTPDRFDDGGFSGGNMDRPALRQLTELVKAGKIDIIVVYKIDRLTRSLTDFAKLAEVLDKHGVSFVSVTQQFNTTTSMGRLMLNVLLSFAQFEREITGERIRDKIAASKRKGMWMGGVPPMGYDIVNRQLVVNERDAVTIRRIFALYLEEGTVPALLERLGRENIRTAARYSAKGNHYGNQPFARGHLYRLLASPIYIGRVPHKTASHQGQHPAIIDMPTWEAVQAQLADNTQGPRNRRRRADAQTHLLEDLLFSVDGHPFTLSHANKGARRYRYYVERAIAGTLSESNSSPTRLPAGEIEAAATGALRSLLLDHRGLLHHLGVDTASETQTVLRSLPVLLNVFAQGPSTALIARFRDLVSTVHFSHDQLTMTCSKRQLRAALGIATKPTPWLSNESPGADQVSFTVPLQRKRRGPKMKLVVPNSESEGPPDRSAIAGMVRVWDWADRLTSGDVRTIGEVSAAEGLNTRYVGRVLPLAFLAPSIVEGILSGEEIGSVSGNRLLWDGRPPLLWEEQLAALRRTKR